MSRAIQELGLSVTDEDLNEEQYYRILNTEGDVAYAQAIDPPLALLNFDGPDIQQVLSSCVTSTVTTADGVCAAPTMTDNLQ